MSAVETKLGMCRLDTSAVKTLQFAKNLLYCDFISLQCAAIVNTNSRVDQAARYPHLMIFTVFCGIVALYFTVTSAILVSSSHLVS